MNTNDLRSIIRDKISEEKRTQKLRKLVAQSAGEKKAAHTVHFVEEYVSVTPDLIDTVFVAAQQQNLIGQFQPIFNEVFNYWLLHHDYIPDHLGLAGICDDAYMSLSLMHLIANTEVPGQGRLLLGQMNLTTMNKNMSIVIGPAIVSQLDATVNTTYQSAAIQNSLAELINIFAGGMSFGNPFMGMQNVIDNYRINEQVDTALGAMGVV